jgi:PAS domain S-box-containing protein
MHSFPFRQARWRSVLWLSVLVVLLLALICVAIDGNPLVRPGWVLLAPAIALFGIYCLSLIYLLRSLRRAEQRQAQLQSDLRSGDEDLRRAHQAGGIGTWWVGRDGQWLQLSPQTVEMFELSRSEMALADFVGQVHPDDRHRVVRILKQAWAGQRAFDLTCRLLLPDHGERWIAVRGAIVEDAGERRVTGTVVDVSERVEIQTLAMDAQRQFRLIFEINPLPCWLFDLDTLRFLEVNPATIRQYGYSREELMSMQVVDIGLPEQAEQVAQRLRQPDPPGRGSLLTVVHRHKDGTQMDVRVHTTMMEIAGLQARLVLAENVSEYMAYQRELAHRASHDATTGLLNVRALTEQLRDAGMPRYTIAHVQLRGLQLIGDTLGRRVGAEVLHRLCERLQVLADEYGWLAFQPSEDFVLAIDEGHDPLPVIDALVTMLSEPVRGRDSLHPLDVRIGVAEFPRDGARADEVIAQAAQAAHAAREADVTVMHFDKSIATHLSERLHLIGRLHEAIDHGEFELHYQPIVDAHSGVPVTLEALVRWMSPERGQVPPDEFIQLCEDTGLILPLGRWAIHQGASDRRRLADAGWADLPIAINISALQLLNSDVPGDVAAACREFGLGHGALHVELTETSLVRDPEQALQAMHRLHAQGVHVSLDDFGTGFSSMSYLQNMPLDSLKIDRSFVTDVDRNVRNAAICQTLITLGHSLGLKVIAEGVERAEQHAWLSENGCDQVQGYLLGRPATLDGIIEMLRGGP